MTTSILKLDSNTLVAPLGLRFHDTASGEFVRDGLNVSVYPPDKSESRVQAIANRTGVYVLHHAPGLRTLEFGAGDQNYWNNLPPRKDFVVEVSDEQRRFQQFHFTAQLPVRGIYPWTSPNSPPSSLDSIPLYSSATRSAPGGMAVIRADLWDKKRDLPAPWAVLEGYIDNELIVRGIADEAGKVALIFPWPAPQRFAINSPPSSPVSSPPTISGPPLMSQEWPVRLRALYAPNGPALSPPDPFETKPISQDLRFTLSQPEAIIWADEAATQPLAEVSLRYGREEVLRSTSTTSPPSSRSSVLFITAAVSPP
jgi:hypothetical protein